MNITKNKKIKIVKWTYHMDRESRERAGSLSRPARRTRICEYHISRQIITAEPIESLKKLQRP